MRICLPFGLVLFLVPFIAHAESVGHLKKLCMSGSYACEVFITGVYEGLLALSVQQSRKSLATSGDGPDSPGYSQRLLSGSYQVIGFCEPPGGEPAAIAYAQKVLSTTSGADDLPASQWLLQSWQSGFNELACLGHNSSH